MASENRHNGGGTGPFNFTFPSIQQSDIKVSVNNNDLSSGFTVNNYNSVSGGNVTFSSNTASGTNNVRIYRETEPETLAATFVSGSSIRAIDLNNCNKQSLFLADENTTKLNALALGNTGSAIVINGSNIADNSITTAKILDLEVKSNDISSSSSNDSLRAITTDHIRDDAITADKLANSINTTIASKITLAQVPTSFVTGMIIMWNTTVATIPSGWVLCDGNNNTPDLRARFIVGVGDGTGAGNSNYSVGNSGGAEQVTLTTAQIPSHNHPIQVRTGRDDNNWSFNSGFSSDNNTSGGTFNSNSTGGGQSHENRPPYYALAFIMKT